MKIKFIQTLAALAIPLSFIGVIIILNTMSMLTLSKYGFGGIIVTFVAILITYIALKIDKRTFKDIGFKWERRTPIRFILGFFIGILTAIVMVMVVIKFTGLELIYNTNFYVPIALLWLLGFLPLAFLEELIFRGYAFIKINKNLGLWPAQILLAILFAWYHDFTGATFFNQLLGPGVWALIYGIAAVWSKGLALPTGLHMALNVVLAIVGQKDGRHAIWYLEYAAEVHPALKAETEIVGMILQICILVIAISLTEFYRRKMRKNHLESKQ